MQRSQVNRAVVARRAAANPAVQHVAPAAVSRNLAMRGIDRIDSTGVGPRKGKTRKAWSHKSSDGRTSLWHSNPFYFSPIEVDVRWSA